MYFFDSPAKRQRLEQLGYEIEQHNSYDMFRRVVRIDRSVPEAALKAEGGRIINREAHYFIIEASIGQLRALVRSGARITAVTGDEPRPRQLRILVASTDDVARLAPWESPSTAQNENGPRRARTKSAARARPS